MPTPSGCSPAPTYTERFHEALETPGPRIPLTADPDLFAQMARHGEKLIWLQTFGERFVRTLPTSGITWKAEPSRSPRREVRHQVLRRHRDLAGRRRHSYRRPRGCVELRSQRHERHPEVARLPHEQTSWPRGIQPLALGPHTTHHMVAGVECRARRDSRRHQGHVGTCPRRHCIA